MTIRELRVTDIRCRAVGCGAGPGEECWHVRRLARAYGANPPRGAHNERIVEFLEIKAEGWEWQEVEPDDAGAADTHLERCTKRSLCTRMAGHDGNCVEVPRYDVNRSEPKRGGR